jgi:hypothetical protein
MFVDEFALAFDLDSYHRSAAARPHAAGGDSLHFGIQLALFDGGIDGVIDGGAA